MQAQRRWQPRARQRGAGVHYMEVTTRSSDARKARAARAAGTQQAQQHGAQQARVRAAAGTRTPNAPAVRALGRRCFARRCSAPRPRATPSFKRNRGRVKHDPTAPCLSAAGNERRRQRRQRGLSEYTGAVRQLRGYITRTLANRGRDASLAHRAAAGRAAARACAPAPQRRKRHSTHARQHHNGSQGGDGARYAARARNALARTLPDAAADDDARRRRTHTPQGALRSTRARTSERHLPLALRSSTWRDSGGALPTRASRRRTRSHARRARLPAVCTRARVLGFRV